VLNVKDEGLYNAYSSTNIGRLFELKVMELDGHIARMEKLETDERCSQTCQVIDLRNPNK
jgi:hypothetical protein